MIQQTRDWFEAFVASQMAADPTDTMPLELKREHCLLVMNEARDLARELALGPRLEQLATVAGLCHDVGRFPQYRRFHTFRDPDSVNHGILGVVTLAREGGLTWLSPTDRHLVRLAIAVHNRKNLPRALAVRRDAAGLLVRIVRDADKLDITRVVLDHLHQPGPRDPVVFLGLPDLPDQFNPALLTTIDTGNTARYETLTTINDFILLLLSWIHTLSFARSRRLFFERGIVRQLFALLPECPTINAFAKRYHDRFAPHAAASAQPTRAVMDATHAATPPS